MNYLDYWNLMLEKYTINLLFMLKNKDTKAGSIFPIQEIWTIPEIIPTPPKKKT